MIDGHGSVSARTRMPERIKYLKRIYHIMAIETTYQSNIRSKPEINQANFVSGKTSEAQSLVVTAKIPSTPEKTNSRKKTDKKEFRSPEEIQWRAEVAEATRAYAVNTCEPEKWLKKAELFENCSLNPKTKFKAGIHEHLPETIEAVLVCPDNKNHDAVVFCETCDNRGCPDCANRQTARLAARFVPVAKELVACRNVGERLRHIVFTTPVSLNDPDCAEKMNDYFNRVHECLNAVQKSYIRKNSAHHKETEYRLDKKIRTSGYDWKKRGGAIVAAEFGEHGRKLHFHVNHYGEFLPQMEVATWWKYLSGGESEVVWLRGITTDPAKVESEIMETVKYSTKFFKSHLDADGNRIMTFIEPELMPKLMDVLDGSRRLRSYGVFYGIDEPEKEPLCCEQCQAKLTRISRDLWQEYQLGGMNAVKLVAGHYAQEHRSSLKSILANKSGNSEANIRGKPPDIPEKPPPKQEKLL